MLKSVSKHLKHFISHPPRAAFCRSCLRQCGPGPHCGSWTCSTTDSAQFFFEHLFRFRLLGASQNTKPRDRSWSEAKFSRLAPTRVSTRHGPLHTWKIESGHNGKRSAAQHPAGLVSRCHFTYRKNMLKVQQFLSRLNSVLATASMYSSQRDCSLISTLIPTEPLLLDIYQ